MRISIVISTYNRAQLLDTTLDHLRTQAFEPGDELIVVDNASTDHTPAVIARAAAHFPVRFVGLQEPTPGKSPALNTGIAAATGDVLALTDDDVLVAGDWLATIRRAFGESTVDVLGGRVEPWWERPAPSWLRVEKEGRYTTLASPLALLHYGARQPLGARTAVGANLAIRSRVLHALGGFAPHLGRRAGTLLCGEDHEFCQRAVAAGYHCEYWPEVRVRHWVPASRLRLTYHVRWFFWSGVTHALLESGTPAGRRLVPRYLVRRLLAAPAAALLHLARGRVADAAEAIMDAAFAFGNISQRMWHRMAGRALHEPRAVAAVPHPADRARSAGAPPGSAVHPAGVKHR